MRKTLFTLLVMTGGLSSVVTAQSIPNGTYVIVSASDPMFAVTNSGNRKKPTNNTAIWPFLSDYSQIWRVENRNGKIVLHALNYDRYVIDNEVSRLRTAMEFLFISIITPKISYGFRKR